MVIYNFSKQSGERFNLLIKSRKLTQAKVALLLSVDEKTIRRWIKDGIDRLSTLELISDKFDVDLITTFLK